jgi:chromosome segregation ATPase
MESSRKRSRISPLASPEADLSIRNASLSMIPSSSHVSEKLIDEISRLKTELSELHALHQLDLIKAENKEKKLKRYILNLEEDTKEANQLAEDMEAKSKEAIKKAAISSKQAKEEARVWEEKYWKVKEEKDQLGDDSAMALLMLEKKRNEQLQQRLELTEAELKKRDEMLTDVVSSTVHSANQEVQDTNDGSTTTPLKQKGDTHVLSPAPPAVLSELNRTRVKLADAELLNRQLSRKIENLLPKSNDMVKYREQALSANLKVEQLERDLKIVRREREALRIIESRWKEFRKDLLSHNLGSDILSHDVKKDTDENIPPEIATVLRQFVTMKEKISSLEREKDERKSQVQIFRKQMQSLETQNTELSTEGSRLKNENTKLMEKLRSTEINFMTIQAKEKVWKREADSMRSLVDTYKQMEANLVKTDPSKRTPEKSSSELSLKGLELSLESARDEIQIMKEQIQTLESQKDEIENRKNILETESEKIRTKFIKLRDALFQEKAKVEKAEERACRAETLAGKGSFNEDTTKVLHIKDNPSAMAIKEKYMNEIASLKRALSAKEEEMLELKSGTDMPKSTTKTPNTLATLDAQKLNKRLKESFKEQIGLFREGVYLITGFKVDMITTDDRPRFKVRSMYAEQEGDYLEFIWPKTEDRSQAVTSLDLLDTELARALSQDTSFQYMQKYKSVPAFMASVCLALFERQTLIA